MKSMLTTHPEEDIQDVDPVAGLSSASACITFKTKTSSTSALLSSSFFNPVYTHQIFGNEEIIKGYQPFPKAQQKSNDIFTKIISKKEDSTSSSLSFYIPHSSYHCPHHLLAKSYIGVNIQLSPSCTKSKVIIYCNDIVDNTVVEEVETQQECNFSESKKRKLTLETSVANNEVMTFDDIIKCISKGLPTIEETIIKENTSSILDNNNDGDDDDDDDEQFLDSPIGTPILEYQRQLNNSNQDSMSTFVLSLANGEDDNVAAYHNEVQKLALWFIENADDVDLTSDEGGGAWKVLYLFQKHEKPKANNNSSGGDNVNNSTQYKYSFVGYVTLFSFFSPFRKPKSGIVLRICQALILPPYQRCGHGKMFFRAVYDYANGKFDDKLNNRDHNDNGGENRLLMKQEIVEVNVEDPAPGFEALRNCMDYELFVKNYQTYESQRTSRDESVIHDLLLPTKYYNNDMFEPIRDSDALDAASKAKVSKTQIHIAYEVYKLSVLNETIEKLKNTNTSMVLLEDTETKYRLMVKKRLNQFHKEELGVYSTKDEKKKKLTEIFDNTMMKYQGILTTMRR